AARITLSTTPDQLFLAAPYLCVNRQVECNLYTYVRGDPLSSIDPSGRIAFPLILLACVGTSVCEVGIAVAAAGLTIVAAKAAAIFMNEQKKEDKPLVIDPEKQGKHQPDAKNFEPGRSELTHPDPQGLLDKHAGKGQEITPSKERVDFGEKIGTHVDGKTKERTETTRGIIHKTKDGKAHIVPSRPAEKAPETPKPSDGN